MEERWYYWTKNASPSEVNPSMRFHRTLSKPFVVLFKCIFCYFFASGNIQQVNNKTSMTGEGLDSVTISTSQLLMLGFIGSRMDPGGGKTHQCKTWNSLWTTFTLYIILYDEHYTVLRVVQFVIGFSPRDLTNVKPARSFFFFWNADVLMFMLYGWILLQSSRYVA